MLLLFSLVLLLQTQWCSCGNIDQEIKVVKDSEVPAYHAFNEGVSLDGIGDVEGARMQYLKALSIKPDLEEALLNLGSLYDRTDRVDEAVSVFHNLLSLPEALPSVKAGACNNLGHMFHKRAGRDVLSLQNSVDWYNEALEHDPQHTDSLYNLGKVYQDLGRDSLSLMAYEKVLEITPHHYEARLNLANYYFSAGQNDRAVEEFDAALATSESSSNAMSFLTKEMTLNNRGQVYRDSNMHHLAENSFEQAYAAHPSFGSYANLFIARRTLCKWAAYQEMTSRLVQLSESECLKRLSPTSSPLDPLDRHGFERISKSAPSLLPYDSLLLASASPSLRRLIADATAKPYDSVTRLPPPPSTSPNIRLAYLSYDFRDHPMGHLTRGLVLGHSPLFHVTALSYGADDKSTHRVDFERKTDLFIDVSKVSPIDAAIHLQSQSIDVCIDLMAHTRGANLHIAALKPCRILVNYLGYPGTFGGTYFDYAMVDAVVAPPESSGTWSEKLAYLPHTYQSNEYSPRVAVCTVETAHICNRGRELLFGSASDRVAICNFNTVDKYEPESFSMWMNILLRNSRATLFLLRPKEPLGSVVENNLHLEAMSRGVSPSRVVFLPRVQHFEHVSRISGCDAFVDSLIYGGHTTMSDFLWASTPSFTVGAYGLDDLSQTAGMASRVGASFLKNLVPHLEPLFVTDSVKELEDSISKALPHLAWLRSEISYNLLRRPHFDTGLITKSVEETVRIMMELQSQKLPAMHIITLPMTKSDPKSEFLHDSIIAAAITAIQSGDEAAPSITQRLASSFPQDSDALHFHGLALRETHPRLACEHIKRAIVLDSNIPFYHSNLASILMDLRENFEAVNSFLAAFDLDPIDQLASGHCDIILEALRKANNWEDERSTFKYMVQKATAAGARSERIAELYEHHALVLNDAGRMDDVVAAYRSAAGLDPSKGETQLKLGAALEAAGYGAAAYEEYFRGVLSIYHRDRLPPSPHIAESRPTLAIFCNEYGQTWWPNWSYASIGTGLGGSEEAAYFMAHAMSNLGYRVIIYNEVKEAEAGPDPQNPWVEWRHHRTYDVENPPDIFIAWRYHISLALATASRGPRPARVFLWLQDAVSGDSFTHDMCDSIDAIFVLSDFHKRLLPGHCAGIGKVTPNGIDVGRQFRNGGHGDGENRAGVMVYGSAPNRGLEILLDMWPSIHERCRVEVGITPKLRVFYGFSKSFVEFGRSGKMGPGFEEWMSGMLDKLHSLPGVEYIGMVSHEDLVSAYADSGLILYPTTYPETGCVTLMKAMCAGAVPVTSRFRDSTIPELTGRWEMGPAEPLEKGWTKDITEGWKKFYVDAVVEAVGKDVRGELSDWRAKMRSESRIRFDWSDVAQRWDEAISLE